jgi:hypothetical protein
MMDFLQESCRERWLRISSTLRGDFAADLLQVQQRPIVDAIYDCS